MAYNTSDPPQQEVDATNNWWGDKTSPSGVGPGKGDSVSLYVNYEPWLQQSTTNHAPQIDQFLVDTASGSAPLAVTFTCEAHDPDGTIASYEWNFGDGTSSTTSQNTASHTYQNAGTFEATCTVVDDQGAEARSQSVSIVVSTPSEESESASSESSSSSSGAGGGGAVSILTPRLEWTSCCGSVFLSSLRL